MQGNNDRKFPPTHWSLVLTARGRATPGAEDAFLRLCEIYWYPIYAYIRGLDSTTRAEAEDLTQGFFASLIEKERFERVSPELGKFRAFLLAAVKHYLSNERYKKRTLKRGGGILTIPLDFQWGETQYRLDPACSETPEILYERRAARELLRIIFQRLHAEYVRLGKAIQFEALRPLVTLEADVPSYQDVAEDLNMSEDSVKVAIHRLRRRFGALLREHFQDTCGGDALEIEEELHEFRRQLEER